MNIYLDNNSTTAIDPKILEIILQELSGPPGNPSSVHRYGKKSREKLTLARFTCASFFGVAPEEILFTSSGTESINLMLKSLNKNGHLITTNIEHSSMETTIQELEKEGMKVTWVSCGPLGAPRVEAIEEAVRSDTVAIALSLANGETGVKIDYDKIAALAEKNGIPLLLDAVAYIGKEVFTLHPAVTAVAMSGHKIHAPKGVGLLIHRKQFPITPLFFGGGQEFRLRSGTENLAGILGLAKALEILKEEQEKITKYITDLRTYFEKKLKNIFPEILINGEGERISNISNVCFPEVDGETLLMQLDLAGIAVSHGSACSSGAIEPSRILLRMGYDRKRVRNSIRFSFSRMNTKEEIDHALTVISSMFGQKEF